MNFTTIGKATKETKLSYLGGINISAKIIKNMKVSDNYTYLIYLAPANQSGYNVCSHSTPECRLGCLSTSGRAGMDITCGANIIKNARIAKTKLFFEQPTFFMDWLIADLIKFEKKAIKDGFAFSVRLNGTSDIDWANVLHNGKNIFDTFPHVTFYDYSKRFEKFIDTPKNYHLTYSYTGRNWDNANVLLQQGKNVAVVFNVGKKEELPATFRGYEVINGDLTDYRVTDGSGVIVGLRFKHIQNKEVEKRIINSCFVVQPNDIDCK